MDPRVPDRAIFFALGPVGDALMLVAVIDQLLRSHPALSITVFAYRNASALRELASHYPQVRVESVSLPALARAYIETWRTRTAIFMPSTFGVLSWRLKMVAAAFGLSPRGMVVGFSDKGKWQPYRQVRSFNHAELYIENLRDLVRSAQFEVAHDEPPLPRLPATAIEGFPYAPGTYLVMQMFAANPIRSLPPKRFTRLISKMREEFPELAIVLPALGSDAETARTVSAGHTGTLIVPDASLAEVAWLIMGAKMYLGPDTGITHLAAVLGAPTVVLGNLSNPTWLPRYSPRARILVDAVHCTCDGQKGGECRVEEDGKQYYRCMYDISDEAILEAVRECLQP